MNQVVSKDYIEKEFITLIQQRAHEVLQQRKKPAVMSAARAISDHIKDWMSGTESGNFVSMGVVSDGSYGIPEGLVFSVPVTCKDFEYHIVEGLEISEFGKEQLKLGIDELIDERDEVIHELEQRIKNGVIFKGKSIMD